MPGKRYKDHTGERYGKLLVVKPVENSGGDGKCKYWECICDCGNTTYVSSKHLCIGKYGISQCKSCRNNNLIASATKHGFSKERLYSIWNDMKRRCYNMSRNDYKNYGGRGITVCDEWGADKLDIGGYINFKTWAFENGYNESLTIDRINNDDGYSPSNCRWVCHTEQSLNKQNTIMLSIKGITKTLIEWSHDSGIKYGTIRRRLQKGWDAESAVFTPV